MNAKKKKKGKGEYEILNNFFEKFNNRFNGNDLDSNDTPLSKWIQEIKRERKRERKIVNERALVERA